jgi:hypothetical protein
MDHHDYLAWLSEIDDLSPYQRIATVRLLAGQPSLEALHEFAVSFGAGFLGGTIPSIVPLRLSA